MISNSPLPPRIGREIRTVQAMISLYCRAYHRLSFSADNGLCPECRQVAEYAEKRLMNCRFGSGKQTCQHCPVHCYRPDMRKKIRLVMRYAGPRMIFRHPAMAFRHLWDNKRK
ncbi:nitrous oxide-stimulated promoter family protein [Prevotella sp. MGM2]|uniref:nitrous oxide-stimulated promoter family protein n=1 Tax=Prevotella sp. MGM2 TaxID=2033406 RepID=UPI001CC09F0C|nr:nitrous oxide-stimulated promoter family protein [Prevotella sp. MGM2]